jgi:hypothetical protein
MTDDLARKICDAINETLGDVGGAPAALTLNFPSKCVLVGLLAKSVMAILVEQRMNP